MKLSEYKNEEAAEKLIVLLDMAEPILKDKEVTNALQENMISAAKTMLKTHPKELIDILAYVDGIPRSEYKISPVGILKKTIALLNSNDTAEVFTSEEQTAES